MIILWEEIHNAEAFVRDRHEKEFNEVPSEFVENGPWAQDFIEISQIQTESAVVERHDEDPTHIKRRNNFIRAILSGETIPPLILLNSERGPDWLVDGYSRYRALRLLGIKIVSVLVQRPVSRSI